ncbi:Hydroxyacylglutathione hydrolase cytoplasmic [Linum perenne]
MKIFHVPCLEDNYAYLIIDEATREAAVVDPVEPEKVVKAANEHGVQLKLVLTTHHHWFSVVFSPVFLLEFFAWRINLTDMFDCGRDHAGGNEKLKQLVPEIKVYGGSLDKVKGCTDEVANGDKISLGADVNILALHTPCHTKGHISYFVTGKEGEDPVVFTGDTLFVAGCGKFFEGTAEQMYQSLCVTLASLPKPTQVYCGHELTWQPVLAVSFQYTVKNLQFAQTVESDNAKISEKLTWAKQQRQAGLPTIPSTIAEEMETNPFIRADLPDLQSKVGCNTAVETLGKIREMKDNWRG